MKQQFFLSVLVLATVTACTATPDKQPEENVIINDFPTQERVDYVLACIAKHGGLTYINQYACGCKIDKIAEKMSFSDFDQARTFGFMRSTAGEAGGVFRDPKEAKRLKKLMQDAEDYAERMCFVK